MSKLPRNHTFKEMLDMLVTRPLQAALQAKGNNVTLTRLKYETSAIAYGVALKLRADSDEMVDFYALEWWLKRDYKRNSDHLLAHVHMYIYGSHKGSEAKRARAHAAALQPYFDSDEPISPKEMADFIADNGGFYGLRERHAPEDGDDEQKRPEGDDEPDVFAGDEEEDNEPAEEVGVGNGAVKPKVAAATIATEDTGGSKSSGAQKGAAQKRVSDPLKGMKREDIANHLLMQWTDDQREELMKLEIGEEVMFTVTRLHDDKSGFAVFELTDFA